MLQFQALKVQYHKIAIRLKILNYKKFAAVPRLTVGQRPSGSLHRLSRIVKLQAAQALTNLCQSILNICTVLNCVTVLKVDIFQ